MLASMHVARKEKYAARRTQDEGDADHRFLDVRPVTLGPGEQQRAGERRRERGDLDGRTLRLESELIGEQDSATRDLRDREVDEHDAAREHLGAQRNVRGGHENSCDERRQEDRNLDGRQIHCCPLRSRAIVSSNRPYRSLAASSPPTVNGSMTALIFARSAIHCEARSL